MYYASNTLLLLLQVVQQVLASSCQAAEGASRAATSRLLSHLDPGHQPA
jgi:hypothetical protein